MRYYWQPSTTRNVCPRRGIGLARDAVGSESVLAFVQLAIFGLPEYAMYAVRWMPALDMVSSSRLPEVKLQKAAWRRCEDVGSVLHVDDLFDKTPERPSFDAKVRIIFCLPNAGSHARSLGRTRSPLAA